MTRKELINEGLTGSVIGAFFEVYNTLGYGFYEHCYTKALEIELGLRGHTVAREVRFPVLYKGHRVGTQRVDMVVDDSLIVESKSTQDLHRGAPRQLFSYLHGSTFEVGLLLHFGPEARFFPIACRNTGSHAITDTDKPSQESLATTRPFPQRSDPSILESLNPSRLLAVVARLRSWGAWRKQRRQLALAYAWWEPAERRGNPAERRG